MSCPVHPSGGRGIRAHGSYRRKTPAGLRVARFYCAEGHVTVGLLLDFMGANFSGQLSEFEQAARVAELMPRSGCSNESSRRGEEGLHERDWQCILAFRDSSNSSLLRYRNLMKLFLARKVRWEQMGVSSLDLTRGRETSEEDWS